eukprot:scaffold5560_cov444-Prasinococcus_capsulatus_cf.AAC.4
MPVEHHAQVVGRKLRPVVPSTRLLSLDIYMQGAVGRPVSPHTGCRRCCRLAWSSRSGRGGDGSAGGHSNREGRRRSTVRYVDVHPSSVRSVICTHIILVTMPDDGGRGLRGAGTDNDHMQWEAAAAGQRLRRVTEREGSRLSAR